MDLLGTLRRRVFDRIGARMALVLAIALLPLAIVSTVRSNTIIRQSQSRSEAALEGETLRAISQELARIENARGAALVLAESMPTLLADLGTCSIAMRRLVEQTFFTFAGFYDNEGRVTCSNAESPMTIETDVEFIARTVDPAPFVEVDKSAPVSQTSVIYAAHPVRDAAGALMGYAALSIPHSSIGAPERFLPRPMREDIVPNVAFVTLNPSGVILTATGVDIADAGAMLPAGTDRVALLGRRLPFSAISEAGEGRTYSVVPVLGGDFYAIGTWPERDVIEETLFYRFPALFPALMWIASLVVAYASAELFVTRHVRRLRTAITRFSDSRRGFAAESFIAAPVELRDMAVSYNEMTDTILREEAELEDTVRQKDVLLREVHHRVKNNLQLIASIMNMQMRKSRSEEARSLMRSLHDRVMSLATVHKGLYQTSGLADVQADELIADIVQQLTHMGSLERGEIRVEHSLEPLRLSPEQAVPLTLLVTEAITNALKYVGHAAGAPARLKVRLEAADERQVRVVVCNTLAPESTRPPEGPLGLGTQLLGAFTQQLHGTLEKRIEDDWYVVSVIFEADALSVAAPLTKPG